MVSKAGLRKEQREKQSRINNGIATIGAIVIGLLLFVLPRTGVWITLDLSFAGLLSLYCVWYCWGLSPTWGKRFGFFVLHGILIIGLGYAVWPRIKVSPGEVSFLGFPDETFNFSVKNERGDDIYDVQIPFLIGYDKHFDSKLSAKVSPNGDPLQPTSNDYNYCYGEKGDGDVSKVMPNEREVLIVNIRHLPPNGNGSFSITYAGGEKFEAQSEAPTFASEPYSYSPVQGTVGVRGDYRICRFSMHSDALMRK
jgi:hypothetical protein